MDDDRPKIIQIITTPNDATWQGRMLGLGDDGVTYFVNNDGRWEKFIPPLGYTGDSGT